MTEPFDEAHFKVMTGDDSALQREIIALFTDQAARLRPVFSPATPAPERRDAAHTLKGSARGLGLFPLADACACAETACGTAAAALALAALHSELDAALVALSAHASSTA